ncbi:ATP-binding cassette domain-containing protein [Rhizobium sp. YIM 134829]|uniref:ATP-binding cassette domain-containing protein n=1 Tax=Rhizobium sp. YIM 134829 TaxID=3390453 RepID=UPI00397B952B
MRRTRLFPRRRSAVPDATGMLALGRRVAALHLRRLLLWQSARLLGRLAFLGFSAKVAGAAIIDGTADVPALAAALLGLVLSVLAGLRSDLAAAEGEAAISQAVARAAQTTIAALPARRAQAIDTGSLVVALQRHPDAIAALVLTHQAARRMMGLGPFVAAATLLLVSWQAALLMLGLTPVMIVFFALIGGLIRSRATAQEAAFGHLAGQFADRIRTLPTILAHHALLPESLKLQSRLEDFAGRTMDVLKIAFLNAAIIDFFASLSIAMLAVLLGLGHLKLLALPGFADLALWQSLFILMIAPDYFAPFRRFAEQYHAKVEGEAAALALDRLLDPPAAEITLPLNAALLKASLPERGLVVLTGPSGAGKTTLLRRLAGIEEDSGDQTFGGGHGQTRWIGMDCLVPAGTLATAIAWPEKNIDPARLEDVLVRLGLAGDPSMPDHLEQGGANLSGGQRLRLSIARALLGQGPVLADEPTAKLDPATAALVRTAIKHMARRRLILVATHDPVLIAEAARRVSLAGTAEKDQAA